jgi:hypothetical protein
LIDERVDKLGGQQRDIGRRDEDFASGPVMFKPPGQARFDVGD